MTSSPPIYLGNVHDWGYDPVFYRTLQSFVAKYVFNCFMIRRPTMHKEFTTSELDAAQFVFYKLPENGEPYLVGIIETNNMIRPSVLQMTYLSVVEFIYRNRKEYSQAPPASDTLPVTVYELFNDGDILSLFREYRKFAQQLCGSA